MAVTCSNCGTILTCGCQRKIASDNTACCDACLEAYEKSIQSTNSPSSNGNQ